MKTALCLITALFIASAFVSRPVMPAAPKTIILQPGVEGKDTYVSDASPDRNSPISELDHIYQGSTGTNFYRALMQWDLSSLPKSAKVLRATMEIYCNFFFGQPSGKVAYYRILEPWDEDKVTFKTQPPYTEDGKVLTEWPLPGTWHVVDLTDFVRGWCSGAYPNNGIYGHCTGTTGQCFFYFSPSDEFVRTKDPHTDTLVTFQPKLAITFDL